MRQLEIFLEAQINAEYLIKISTKIFTFIRKLIAVTKSPQTAQNTHEKFHEWAEKSKKKLHREIREWAELDAVFVDIFVVSLMATCWWQNRSEAKSISDDLIRDLRHSFNGSAGF